MHEGGRKRPSSLVSSDGGAKVGARGPCHSKRATEGEGGRKWPSSLVSSDRGVKVGEMGQGLSLETSEEGAQRAFVARFE